MEIVFERANQIWLDNYDGLGEFPILDHICPDDDVSPFLGPVIVLEGLYRICAFAGSSIFVKNYSAYNISPTVFRNELEAKTAN